MAETITKNTNGRTTLLSAIHLVLLHPLLTGFAMH